MHRFILGDKNGLHVDHINGNPLDNQRSNLRHVTRAQNLWNAKICKVNTTGHKGVYLDNRYGKPRWNAVIWVNGKQINLGRYFEKVDAIAARRTAEITYHGEFARR